MAEQDPVTIVGANLRRLRKAKNLNQSDVAAALGVGWQTVSRYERTGRVPIDVVPRLTGFLEADPRALFADGPAPRRVTVSLVAEAEVFVSDPDLAEAKRFKVTIDDDAEIAGLPLEAALVRGDSASPKYPDGSVVLFVPYNVEHRLIVGRRYVVKRQTARGAECSIRRLVKGEDGTFWAAEHPMFAAFANHSVARDSDTPTYLYVLGRIVRAIVHEPPP